MSVKATVIVRAKDKVGTIEATLRGLRAQTRPVEVVVVDSGSTDGTLDVAHRWADRVIEIPSERFTYGRALNVGAAAASGSVHFALSAHSVPVRDDWIECSLALYRHDDRIAATNHAILTPDGRPIRDYYVQTLGDARTAPGWGFSNHAGSWRADVWEEQRFREDLPACEDKEWSWRVLLAGWRIAYSPQVDVPSSHRRKKGLLDLHRRVAREAQAMVGLGAARPLTPRDAVRMGWSYFSPYSSLPHAVRRLSPYRVAELTGAVSGSAAASRSGILPAELFVGENPGWREERPPYNPLL